jgi:hypothetical protein
MSEMFFFIVDGVIEDAGKHRGVARFDYEYYQTHGKPIECFTVDEKDVISDRYPFEFAPDAVKTPCIFEDEETPEEHEEFINSFSSPSTRALIREYEKKERERERANESSLGYLRRVRPNWSEARRLDVMWRSMMVGKKLHDIVPEEEATA